MNQDVTFRKVSIRPIELLKQARDLMGDQYWLFVGITFVGMLIASAVPLYILMGPMMCGIYLCYLERSRKQQVEFGLLFKGFDYFVESLIATLIMIAVLLVILVPAYVVFLVAFLGVMFSSQGEPDVIVAMGVSFVLYAVILVLVVVVTLPFMFVYQLIVDRQLKAWPAVKTSCRAVMSNLFGLLVMTFVYMFISIVAACFCYVPAILFMPLAFGGYFLAYRNIFPENEKELQS